jgi:deoxyribodipyrimidine photo-lyase
MTTAIVWFRADLRLDGNPAWAAATSSHDRVVALFVLDRRLWQPAGEHRRRLLAAHLEALDERLAGRGGRLRVEEGDPAEVVPALAGGLGADEVHWNADVGRYAGARDGRVAARLGESVVRHWGRYVHPPGTILTAAGDPYRVFTPFSRVWESAERPTRPLPGEADVAGDPGRGVPEAGTPVMAGGEGAAAERLEAFLDRADRYRDERDRPDLDSTSRLSADLKFGTIDPLAVVEQAGDDSPGRRAFVRQLCWRDFYAHLMAAFPETAIRAMRPEYEAVPWREDPEGLAAWREGRTGYPIVDAGMRQLTAEGWMHNRVRMIAASFLVKDLLIDWRVGERHFRRLLVDADLPQNVGNWQWVAGTGADAAPYFRIFNPTTQARKFDPQGDYVRRWVPELSGIAGPAVHTPWELGPLELSAAGVTIGADYPAPIVDHAEARLATLEAYEQARGAR